MASAEAVQTVWLTTLVIYGIVVAVVGILLTLILNEVRRIHDGVEQIWNVGQKIANNTIHIALLDTTNHVAGRILASAGGVMEATAALERHARDCPGCPHCVLGGGGA